MINFKFLFKLDLIDISSIDFYFSDSYETLETDPILTKSYPTAGTVAHGAIYMPVENEEIEELPDVFYAEAVINFNDNTSIKAHARTLKNQEALLTTILNDGDEDIDVKFHIDESSGGSGTSDYTDLTNKPRINNIELIGNKTTSDLGLDITTGDGLKREDNTMSVDIDANSILEFNNHKLSADTSGLQPTISGGNGISVSSDVVSVDLKSSGSFLNFSSGKLGVNTESLGASQLREYLSDSSILSGFPILATKTYVDNLISTSLKRLVVEQLPQNPNTYTIYMVLRQAPTTNNIYDEYMYINNAWELIGSTEVDLSNYYTKSETNAITQALANNISLSIDDNTFFVTVALKHDDTTLATYTTDLYISDLFQNIDNCFTALSNKQDLLTFSNGLKLDDTDNTLSVSLDAINGYLDFNNNGELQVDIQQISQYPSFRSELANSNYAFALQPKLTAGTNITIDSNNVISASGGSYTFTDGLAESSGTVGIDLASGSKLLIDSNDKLDVDLSSKQDTIDSTHKLDADYIQNGSNYMVIPKPTAADVGKVLKVNTDGEPEWVSE